MTSAPSAIKIRRSIGIFTLFLWSLLTLGGALRHPGTAMVYLLFSCVFLLLLLSGFYRRTSYGYMFLAIFLWLGFWVKYTIHVIFDYPFIESVGNFYGSNHAWHRSTWIAPVSFSAAESFAWDDVLLISAISAVAVLVAQIIYARLVLNVSASSTSAQHQVCVPSWYEGASTWLWSVGLGAIVLAAFCNAFFGIQQAGLLPMTILPWPLNALISWFVSMGGAMCIATLLHWNIESRKPVTLKLYAIAMEAFLSSVTLLSRAVYIFHVLPQLLGIYELRRHLQKITIPGFFGFMAVVAILFFGSVVGVNALRSHLYESAAKMTLFPVSTKQTPGTSEVFVPNPVASPRSQVLEAAITEVRAMISEGKNLHGQLQKLVEEKAEVDLQAQESQRNILQLAADRWVGIEGVMAIQSYEEKSTDTLLRAIKEKREIGKLGMYEQISNSPYAQMDPSKNQFASLPGAVAFFLLGGAWWTVAAGMFLLVFILLGVEGIIFRATRNPLLCSLIGLFMANTVAQLGGSPRQIVPYFLTTLGGVGFICLLQSNSFTWLLKKTGLHKTNANA